MHCRWHLGFISNRIKTNHHTKCSFHTDTKGVFIQASRADLVELHLFTFYSWILFIERIIYFNLSPFEIRGPPTNFQSLKCKVTEFILIFFNCLLLWLELATVACSDRVELRCFQNERFDFLKPIEALKFKSQKIEKRAKPGCWVASPILLETEFYCLQYSSKYMKVKS